MDSVVSKICICDNSHTEQECLARTQYGLKGMLQYVQNEGEH